MTNEKLLLTPEEVEQIFFECGQLYRPSFKYLTERLNQDQLAKAQPIIEKQKDEEWITTTNKIIDRGVKAVEEAKKQERWNVGEELCCLIGNLMLVDKEKGKLLGDQLNEYMKHYLKGAE
ncbi:MAG: hypothetical protein KKD44_26330 [Proteobacteria bacterium]|nr:hypothetical protein [Pseudomonadota bacterium]